MDNEYFAPKESTITPAFKGFMALLLSIIAASAVFSTVYLPYRSYKRIQSRCTQKFSAVVTDDAGQSQEGIFFYGPQVEFKVNNVYPVRSKAVNTVQIKDVPKKDSEIEIMANPKDHSEIVLKDDKTAKNRFLIGRAISIAALVVGAALFVFGIIRTYKAPKPKSVKNKVGVNGETYAQWKKAQKKKELENKDKDEKAEVKDSAENKDSKDE